MESKIYLGAQVSQADKLTIERGVSSQLLMERAGRAAFSEISARVWPLYGKKAFVFCGKGNNGGDGLVVARWLRSAGCEVTIVTLFRPGEASEVMRRFLLEARGVGARVVEATGDLNDLKAALADDGEVDLIVDAIFGTGLSGEIRGIHKEVIELVNSLRQRTSSCVVCAIDVPSGVESDTGRILGCAIKADLTVTFTALKYGLINQPGASFAGEVVLRRVGVIEEYLGEPFAEVITLDLISGQLIKRKEWSHKGDVGKLLVIAGSVGMAGAAALVARSAFLAGAGLVRVALPENIYPIVSELVPEATFLVQKGDEECLTLDFAYQILDAIEASDAVVLGPGISRRPESLRLARDIVRSSPKPVVLDADGIVAVSEMLDVLRERKAGIILTPHPGEMARLVGEQVTYERRHEILRQFCRVFSACCVLKGSRSLVCDALGKLYVNLTGNSGMATAGSGDVLSGVIGALLAAGNAEVVSALAGVFIHGRAGDLAAEVYGRTSVTATAIANFLPEVFSELKLWEQ